MTRKALGRGLSALLREVETTSKGLEEIPAALIDPNPFQPRRTFPEEALRELANSIRSSGILQPVIVRRFNARYQIIVGERRLRAAKLGGLEKVPAVIRDLSDNQALELALAENLLREDLNPLEIARAYQMLLDQFALKHEQVADRLGISRSAVTNTLRLLRLPPKVQAYVESGDLSEGHARALASLASPAQQEVMGKLMVERGLTVRQAEAVMARQRRPFGAANKLPGSAATVDANIRAALTELERTLGTRVRLVGSQIRGRIEIKYFSAEDLVRIVDVILRK